MHIPIPVPQTRIPRSAVPSLTRLATNQALSLAGIPDANLIQYRQPLNLANLFQFFGKSEAKAIKIDLGVDLPKLKSGRLYFLSPLLLY